MNLKCRIVLIVTAAHIFTEAFSISALHKNIIDSHFFGRKKHREPGQRSENLKKNANIQQKSKAMCTHKMSNRIAGFLKAKKKSVLNGVRVF